MKLFESLNVVVKKAIAITVIVSMMPVQGFALETTRTANSGTIGDLFGAIFGRLTSNKVTQGVAGIRAEARFEPLPSTAAVYKTHGSFSYLTADGTPVNVGFKKLESKAKEAVSNAFATARTFEFIPAQVTVTKDKDGITLDETSAKKLEAFLLSWKRTREAQEQGNKVLPDELDLLRKDALNSIYFIKTLLATSNPAWRDRFLTHRFVLVVPEAVENVEQGNLMEAELGIRPPALKFYGPHFNKAGKQTSLYYGESNPGFEIDDNITVLGFRGFHDYQDAAEVAESIYLPLNRLKRYARLENQKETTRTFGLWLSSLIGNEAASIDSERAVHSQFLAEHQVYADALQKTHNNRLREYKVDVELLALLSTPTIAYELIDAVKSVLAQAKKDDLIVDYNVVIAGDDLTLWISHKKSTHNLNIKRLAESAVQAAIDRADQKEMLKTQNFDPKILRWRNGNIVYTVRDGAEPTLRVKYFGGSRKSVDLALRDAYANPSKTTMHAIETIPGWYFVSQNLDDLRAAKPEVEGTLFRFPVDIDHIDLELRDEHFALTAVFPGKQEKIRMDEPVAMALLDSLHADDENMANNPELRPFSPWIWFSQHSGKEAKGSTEGVTLEPGVIVGPDKVRAVFPVKISEASTFTWAQIQSDTIAPAIGIESLMTAKGGYDSFDVVELVGRTTEYEDLAPGFAFFRKLVKDLGDFEPALTPRNASLQAQKVWEELEQNAKRPEVRVRKIGDVELNVPAALTDRKKGELPQHWTNVRANQLFTLTIKKGDIGGIGHGAPEPIYIPTATASFEEIANRPDSPLIDFYNFEIGDDLQFLMVHKENALNDEIGSLAWQSFWRPGWVVKALQKQPYGFMQDAPGAKNRNSRYEANLTNRFMSSLVKHIRLWAQDPAVENYYRLNNTTAEEVVAQLESEYRKPQIILPDVQQENVQLAGNLVGSGFGNADLVVTPWLYNFTKGNFGFLGFDKASPAVYNPLVVLGARNAVQAGDLEDVYIDVQNVHLDRRVLLSVKDDFDTIMKLTGNSSGFQISDLWTHDDKGNLHQLGSFTTDRLFQVLMALTGKPAYGGKDDPESVFAWVLGKHIYDAALAMNIKIDLGNERGSNKRPVRFTPLRAPFLGQYSDPTAAGARFHVNKKGIIVSVKDRKVQDLFDSKTWEKRRQDVKIAMAMIRAHQGSHGPLSAAELSQLEPAYPAPAARELTLADESRRLVIRKHRTEAVRPETRELTLEAKGMLLKAVNVWLDNNEITRAEQFDGSDVRTGQIKAQVTSNPGVKKTSIGSFETNRVIGLLNHGVPTRLQGNPAHQVRLDIRYSVTTLQEFFDELVKGIALLDSDRVAQYDKEGLLKVVNSALEAEFGLAAIPSLAATASANLSAEAVRPETREMTNTEFIIEQKWNGVLVDFTDNTSDEVVEAAIATGAEGATSNPFSIGTSLVKGNDPKLLQLLQDAPQDLKGRNLLKWVYWRRMAQIANHPKFRAMFAESKGKKGFVSVEVDPTFAYLYEVETDGKTVKPVTDKDGGIVIREELQAALGTKWPDIATLQTKLRQDVQLATLVRDVLVEAIMSEVKGIASVGKQMAGNNFAVKISNTRGLAPFLGKDLALSIGFQVLEQTTALAISSNFTLIFGTEDGHAAQVAYRNGRLQAREAGLISPANPTLGYNSYFVSRIEPYTLKNVTNLDYSQGLIGLLTTAEAFLRDFNRPVTNDPKIDQDQFLIVASLTNKLPGSPDFYVDGFIGGGARVVMTIAPETIATFNQKDRAKIEARLAEASRFYESGGQSIEKLHAALAYLIEPYFHDAERLKPLFDKGLMEKLQADQVSTQQAATQAVKEFMIFSQGPEIKTMLNVLSAEGDTKFAIPFLQAIAKVDQVRAEIRKSVVKWAAYLGLGAVTIATAGGVLWQAKLIREEVKQTKEEQKRRYAIETGAISPLTIEDHLQAVIAYIIQFRSDDQDVRAKAMTDLAGDLRMGIQRDVILNLIGSFNQTKREDADRIQARVTMLQSMVRVLADNQDLPVVADFTKGLIQENIARDSYIEGLAAQALEMSKGKQPVKRSVPLHTTGDDLQDMLDYVKKLSSANAEERERALFELTHDNRKGIQRDVIQNLINFSNGELNIAIGIRERRATLKSTIFALVGRFQNLHDVAPLHKGVTQDNWLEDQVRAEIRKPKAELIKERDGVAAEIGRLETEIAKKSSNPTSGITEDRQALVDLRDQLSTLNEQIRRAETRDNPVIPVIARILANVAKMKAVSVIPIRVGLDKAIAIGEASIKQGIAAELTFRGNPDDVVKGIAELKQRHPEQEIAGGTIHTAEQVRLAHHAGATVVVSPGIFVDVVSEANFLNILAVPGVNTVREAQKAIKAGAQVLKFFPFSIKGNTSEERLADLIGELRGPLPDKMQQRFDSLLQKGFIKFVEVPETGERPQFNDEASYTNVYEYVASGVQSIDERHPYVFGVPTPWGLESNLKAIIEAFPAVPIIATGGNFRPETIAAIKNSHPRIINAGLVLTEIATVDAMAKAINRAEVRTTADRVLDAVTKTVRRVRQIGSIQVRLTNTMEDLKMDSLGLLEIAMDVEREFSDNFEINSEEIKPEHSVNDIAALVNQKLETAAQRAEFRSIVPEMNLDHIEMPVLAENIRLNALRSTLLRADDAVVVEEDLFARGAAALVGPVFRGPVVALITGDPKTKKTAAVLAQIHGFNKRFPRSQIRIASSAAEAKQKLDDWISDLGGVRPGAYQKKAVIAPGTPLEVRNALIREFGKKKEDVVLIDQNQLNAMAQAAGVRHIVNQLVQAIQRIATSA